MFLELRYKKLLADMSHGNNRRQSALSAVFKLLSASRAIDGDCAARLKPFALSEAKFVILYFLQQNGDCAPHQLAQFCGVTRATITGLIDGLEKSQYVMRMCNTTDRRQIVICLTPQGRQLIESVFATHGDWINNLTHNLSDDELRLLDNLLSKIWAQTDVGQIS